MDVSSSEKIGNKSTISHAEDKLTRLLETERELARVHAQRHVEQLESRLEAEKESIRAQIVRECDEEVASIKEAAEAQTARLDDLSNDTISALADHVVRLLVGTEEPGGRR